MVVADHDRRLPHPSLLRHASPLLLPSKLFRSLSSKLRSTNKALAPDVSSDHADPPPHGRVLKTDYTAISAQMNGIHSSSASDILRAEALRVPGINETSIGRHPCKCFLNGETTILRNSHSIKTELTWNAEHCKYDILEAETLRIVDDGDSSWRWNGGKQCGCFASRIIDHQNRLKREWESRKVDRKTQKKERSHGHLHTGDERQVQCCSGLHDDVVEMCLAKASFSTVMCARIVCRKWRALTMSPHFLATREKLGSKKPWLFLFGISRDGISNGEIHALDVVSDRWHSMPTDMLRGRYLFSVVCLNSLVYIIGGCSNLPSSYSTHDNKSNTKTHRGVLVFDPFTCSWTKCCSMGVARAMPIAAVFEVRQGEVATSSSSQKLEGIQHENDSGNLSSSVNRSGWCNFDISSETLDMDCIDELTAKLKKTGREHHIQDRTEKLIIVGGRGMWKEALFTAEIYDPVTDTWREIAKLPADHGVTSAGVVCNGFFYAYSESDKLAAYDFRFNTWSNIQISNSLTRLHEYVPKLVCCNGRLILLGVTWGSSEIERCDIIVRNNVEAATRTVWELDLSSRTWHQICKHPDAPLDWNAVSVSEGSQIYGIEMFKIFGQVLDFVTVCDISSSKISWKRMSRMRLGNNLDVSSCFAKCAVMVQL